MLQYMFSILSSLLLPVAGALVHFSFFFSFLGHIPCLK
uniref:Uncharacterized protein n=1 Tax=Arundo donax TaxID=35708 RepID=A0A0A9G2K3_ARUDO